MITLRNMNAGEFMHYKKYSVEHHAADLAGNANAVSAEVLLDAEEEFRTDADGMYMKKVL